MMKNIMMLSVLTDVLTLTGCTTLKNVVGNDMSGTHEVQATSNNTAPVTSKNGVLVDATNHMTLYTFDKDSMNQSDCGAACQVLGIDRHHLRRPRQRAPGSAPTPSAPPPSRRCLRSTSGHRGPGTTACPGTPPPTT